MTRAFASRWRCESMRLPTKPGHTPTRAATLLIFLASFMQVAMTVFEVFSPRTISSSFITLAGEKKCVPITASGRPVAAAISSTFRYEVLVAKIAPGLQIASSLPKMSFLMSMRSNTASTTMSTPARAFMSSEPVIRLMRFSTSSAVMPPRAAVRS